MWCRKMGGCKWPHSVTPWRTGSTAATGWGLCCRKLVMRNRGDKCWARCTLTEWRGQWSRDEKNETPVLLVWPPLLLQTKSLRHFKWSGCWRHLWAEWMYWALNKIKQHSPFVFVYAHGNSNCSCQKYLFSETAHACALLLMWATQFGFGENLSGCVWAWEIDSHNLNVWCMYSTARDGGDTLNF